MKKTVQKSQNGLKGEVVIPSDKSISHRAVMFASLAKGKSIIKNFSKSKDPMSSLNVCKSLGINAEFCENNLKIVSDGKLHKPESELYCGNSGTTMRLMTGILAGQNFTSILTGDESLSKRPMKRIIEPLTLMNANIWANDFKAPLKICGTNLKGIHYKSKLASAQVKSCVLLAGLQADEKTIFEEPYISRNHTEIMLKSMGCNITTNNNIISITKSELSPLETEISGDISSAAYFMVAALIIPNSKIIIKNVGLNPTRCGILQVIEKMGGNINILDKRTVSGEDVGDIAVSYSELKSCTIEGELIPKLIDELPCIAVLATQAKGTTIVKNAEDLRNKESDRIKAIVTELKKIGADIEETFDGFIINGKSNLKGECQVETYQDHRLAMSLYIAGLICEKPIVINGFEWISISFPEFEEKFYAVL